MVKWPFIELGVNHPKAIPLFCNRTLHVAKNSFFMSNIKHIEVDCHFVRDAIIDGLIDPSFVPAKAQLVDLLLRLLASLSLIFSYPSWAFFILPILQLEGGVKEISACG